MVKKENSQWFPWDYLVVTFGFSWLCWLPAVLETRGVPRLPVPREIFLVLVIFGPFAGALWATVRRGNSSAPRDLLRRVLER